MACACCVFSSRSIRRFVLVLAFNHENNALIFLVSRHGDLIAEVDESEGMARLSPGWRYGVRRGGGGGRESSQLYHLFAPQGGLNSSLALVPNRCSDSGPEVSLFGWFARAFQTPDKKYPQ
jgi:hypothetical protein